MGFLDFVNEKGLQSKFNRHPIPILFTLTHKTALDSWHPYLFPYDDEITLVRVDEGTQDPNDVYFQSAFYGPSQADVACYKQIKSVPEAAKYPHAYRWYKHMSSYESEFSSLPGDPSKAYTTYGPEQSELTVNPKDAPDAAAAEDDDEVDLFASDDESEDEEAKRIKEENLAAYKKKKEGKVKPAAKSIVTLDVKPWDDETDMKELESNMRSIEMDGLTWGASKLVPVGYGISKLQVNVVVEDEKVSVDDLQGKIEGDEDHVQSTDVAAMQKL